MAKIYLISILEKKYLPTKKGKQFLYHQYLFNSSASFIEVFNIEDLENLLLKIENKILMFNGRIPKVIFRYLSRNKKKFENFLNKRNCILASYERDSCFVKKIRYHFNPIKKELDLVYIFFKQKRIFNKKSRLKNNSIRFHKSCKRRFLKKYRKIAA